MDCGRRGCFPVVSQQIRLIESDRSRVLFDVAGVVDSARKTIKVAVFNCGEMPHAELRARSDGFKADALVPPPTPYAENPCLRHITRLGTNPSNRGERKTNRVLVVVL